MTTIRVPTIAFIVLAISAAAGAADRFALIVTGASGGPEYAQRFAMWRTAFVETLRTDFEYPVDHIVVLSEDQEGPGRPTRESVQSAIVGLARRVRVDDVLLVLLMGHGTSFYDEPAKFNLVGPDLTAREWAGLLAPVAGRVVFVNATGASFPFLGQLAAPGRVVLTATDTAAQRYDTVLPQFFVAAFTDLAADVDKNGRVSVWEAFQFASAGIKGWFETRGQLATERPLLDDTGDGIGVAADAAGSDGAVARTTYLQPDVLASAAGRPELAALYRQRAEVETRLGELKAGKAGIPPDQYEGQLETLLLELARLDREIRDKR